MTIVGGIFEHQSTNQQHHVQILQVWWKKAHGKLPKADILEHHWQQRVQSIRVVEKSNRLKYHKVACWNTSPSIDCIL